MTVAAREKRAETASEAQTAAGAGRRLNEARWSRPGERDRSAELNRRRWADREYSTRVGEAISEAHSRPSVQVKLSAAAVRRWSDPTYRANCLAGMRASHRSERYRKLMSEIRTAQWRDPTYRARGIAAIRRRAGQHSDFMKGRWAAKRREPLAIVRPPITASPRTTGYSMLGGRLARPVPPRRGTPVELPTSGRLGASSLVE